MTRPFGLLTLGAALAAGPALAHHPLAGAPMTTFADGALSGVGHPLLGFDHLFFVAAAGVAAVAVGRRFVAPLAYLATMIAGVVLAATGLTSAVVEPVVGLSLLALGGALALGGGLRAGAVMALFAGFGLFHGWAFGGAIAGQEGGAGAAVLAGYLTGLAATQYALALVAGFAAERLGGALRPAEGSARLVGAAVAGMGVLLSLEAAEGAAFAALGWG